MGKIGEQLKKKAEEEGWAATHADGSRAGKKKKGKVKVGPEKRVRKGLFQMLDEILYPSMLKKD